MGQDGLHHQLPQTDPRTSMDTPLLFVVIFRSGIEEDSVTGTCPHLPRRSKCRNSQRRLLSLVIQYPPCLVIRITGKDDAGVLCQQAFALNNVRVNTCWYFEFVYNRKTCHLKLRYPNINTFIIVQHIKLMIGKYNTNCINLK